jgi:hypothetical protein
VEVDADRERVGLLIDDVEVLSVPSEDSRVGEQRCQEVA